MSAISSACRAIRSLRSDDRFRFSGERSVVPALKSGGILIMDKSPAHKNEDCAISSRAGAGAQLRYLLSYAPTSIQSSKPLPRSERKNTPDRCWGTKLREQKYPKIVAVALANKTARIAWPVRREMKFTSCEPRSRDLARRSRYDRPAVRGWRDVTMNRSRAGIGRT